MPQIHIDIEFPYFVTFFLYRHSPFYTFFFFDHLCGPSTIVDLHYWKPHPLLTILFVVYTKVNHLYFCQHSSLGALQSFVDLNFCRPFLIWTFSIVDLRHCRPYHCQPFPFSTFSNVGILLNRPLIWWVYQYLHLSIFDNCRPCWTYFFVDLSFCLYFTNRKRNCLLSVFLSKLSQSEVFPLSSSTK